MRILCRVKAGSHLFGTNTPKSDTDYKGVFIPDVEDLLMGEYKQTRNESTGPADGKNTSEDIDSELWSLKKFFNMIFDANNHALEVLFAPEDCIVETSKEWETIRSMKHQLVCSKVANYITYCNSQAAKYGIKGTRVRSVKNAIDFFEKYNKDHARLLDCWDEARLELKDIKHIEFFDSSELQPVAYVEINDRKFQNTVSVEYTVEALRKIYKNYGDRAIQAEKNEGIDWKAISHAYRVGMQAYELLETGSITLPMKEPERSYTMALKANRDNLTIPFEEVRPILESLADDLKAAVERSTLRDEVNPKWKDYVFEIYLKEVVEFQRERVLYKKQVTVRNY